jgi:hypothetical protein
MELDRGYAALSAVRFMDGWSEDAIRSSLVNIEAGHTLRLKDPAISLFENQGNNSKKPTPPPTDAPSQALLFTTS